MGNPALRMLKVLNCDVCYQSAYYLYMFVTYTVIRSFKHWSWSEIAHRRGNLLTDKPDKTDFAFLSVARQLAWCDWDLNSKIFYFQLVLKEYPFVIWMDYFS